MHPYDYITLTFNNVTMVDSKWIIHGFNVIINGTNLSEILLENSIQYKTVRISRSQFEHLKSSPGYKISMWDCAITGSISEKALMDITDCDLEIFNCTFHHIKKENSGPAILNAVNSRIWMYDITCSQNNATYGLIHIKNNSQLHLDSSLYVGNGYYIIFTAALMSTQFNSSVYISNCTLENNHGRYGSCLFCDSNTTVIIENTKFVSNSAW